MEMTTTIHTKQPDVEVVPVPKKMLWTGRIISHTGNCGRCFVRQNRQAPLRLRREKVTAETSAATVFGHMPLAFVSGPGPGARNSIGIVLVAGMTIGTLFTLFIVPVCSTR